MGDMATTEATITVGTIMGAITTVGIGATVLTVAGVAMDTATDPYDPSMWLRPWFILRIQPMVIPGTVTGHQDSGSAPGTLVSTLTNQIAEPGELSRHRRLEMSPSVKPLRMHLMGLPGTSFPLLS